MLIRIQCEDGQDFLVGFGEGSVSVAIATTSVGNSQPPLEEFTIEEAEAIIKAIQIAIDGAKTERDLMENHNGN
jgi:hypothetical protein